MVMGLGKLKNKLIFSAMILICSFVCTLNSLYTWISDFVFRGIGHCYLIIQIFFDREVIQISKVTCPLTPPSISTINTLILVENALVGF